MNDEQLTQRIRSASEAIVMPDSTQARQLEAISAALSQNEVASIDSIRARRRIVASIVAAAMIAPAGLAAASETSLPGDPLYSVKQLSEKVLVLFDAEVIARHRIEEIEALEVRGASDLTLVENARLALTELGSDHALWQRLEASIGEADPDEDDGGETPLVGSSGDDRSDDAHEPSADPEPETLTVDLPDGTSAAITVDDDIIQIVAPIGWTVTESDGDRVRVTNGTIEVEIELLADGSARVREVGLSDGDDSASRDDEIDAADESERVSGSSGEEHEGDDESRSRDDDPDDDDDSDDS